MTDKKQTEDTMKKTLTMSTFFILWEFAGSHSKFYIVTEDDLLKDAEKKAALKDSDAADAQKKYDEYKELSISDGFINQMQHLLSANVKGYSEKSLDEIEKIVDERIQRYSDVLRQSRSKSSIPKYPKKRRSTLSTLARDSKRKSKIKKTLKLTLK